LITTLPDRQLPGTASTIAHRPGRQATFGT